MPGGDALNHSDHSEADYTTALKYLQSFNSTGAYHSSEHHKAATGNNTAPLLSAEVNGKWGYGCR